jgi:hypothetical protein
MTTHEHKFGAQSITHHHVGGDLPHTYYDHAADAGVPYEYALADFSAGQRVETHPATSAWIMGDRYGEVEIVGRKWVHVRMDRSGRVRKFAPRNLMPG